MKCGWRTLWLLANTFSTKMGTGPYRRKKRYKGDHPIKEKYRTKRKTKDLDEIQDDLKPTKVQKLINQEIDDDKPGQAQHYCIHCAKYCIDDKALQAHMKSKPHKKRLKALKTEVFSQEDAERCAGMGSFKAPKPFNTDIPTMDTDSTDEPAGQPTSETSNDPSTSSL
ncbi:zinc finger protein 593-like [Watersipora subatra]|uniref:zinc finger protein 593-like n=1 Tax=Watersipora subatra TaxID=2589382 RepID=UPI00355C3CA1